MPTVLNQRRATVGWGQTVDSRIAPDVIALEDRFKVKITAGYDPGGPHASDGDHPKGLAVDIVPDTARGGTWADVNKLAGWAAEHADVFRFVGYDGRFGTTAWPGHGEGDHLHLSWHGAGTAGDTAPLKTIASDKSLLDTLGGVLSAVPGVGTLGLVGGAVPDVVKDAAGDAATSAAKGAVSAIWGAVGDDGARALLYVLLVLGGAALAVVGIARATGVGQKLKTAAGTAAMVTPVGRGAKVAGAL